MTQSDVIRSVPMAGGDEARRRRRGILASMRVRKKLLFLHTLFSLALGAFMLVALRPAVSDVVAHAELDEARLILRVLRPSLATPGELGPIPDNVDVRRGTAEALRLDPTAAALAIARGGEPVDAATPELGRCVVGYVGGGSQPVFVALVARIPDARRAVWRLYAIACGTLLAAYVLVALALEVFVLPQNVYRPIASLLAADRAAQEGRPHEELVPGDQIPSDELGEIMRSRNRTIMALRRNESALAEALAKLEAAANDLKRKNHLLETARRNLADADRLASLGMMSAGIAHELNTPLSVIKGLVEKLNASRGDAGTREVPETDAALMLRVVKRLERLGEGLLDFARARPPRTAPVDLRAVVAEALTLIALDPESGGVEFANDVPPGLVCECDGDRLVQVLVNLVRNAVDAVKSARRPGARGRVVVEGAASRRDAREWVTLTVTDDGPGISAQILPRLFEPFASTRLDARGTGLGLAVAEGIVREHAGVILARNREDGRPGAAFEVMLPKEQGEPVVSA